MRHFLQERCTKLIVLSSSALIEQHSKCLYIRVHSESRACLLSCHHSRLGTCTSAGYNANGRSQWHLMQSMHSSRRATHDSFVWLNLEYFCLLQKHIFYKDFTGGAPLCSPARVLPRVHVQCSCACNSRQWPAPAPPLVLVFRVRGLMARSLERGACAQVRPMPMDAPGKCAPQALCAYACACICACALVQGDPESRFPSPDGCLLALAVNKGRFASGDRKKDLPTSWPK